MSHADWFFCVYFSQHIKDKFWNFIFYKFIFIFGIVNVQHIHEIVLWITWFSGLGFLHIMTQLSKDRFEYVSRMMTYMKVTKTNFRVVV